ncbi:hypothetical protein QBC40DRAFT_334368 [Triangularia verruculosa]|uniref:Uncharacterized protein n=1 Tax=Triangularia verruculosa TaxID=2587418 RepID=A0AAN6XD12_9PEZI|nr:hypothetical protein QBC40DRAFT_334368 [Triangularia verruculosa]
MKSQKPTPPRNARAPSSSPTSIPAPVDNNPSSTDEPKNKQDEEERLEDVLKKWSSTPSRQSLPFLSDLHKVGRLYDDIIGSRSHRREEQFDAMDKTRSHLDNVLKTAAAADSKGKGAADNNNNNMLKKNDDKEIKAVAEVVSTPGPKQQQQLQQQQQPPTVARFFDRPSLKHLKVKATQDLPCTPAPMKKTAIFSSGNGPTAPGSKVSDVTPWRRASPPTPTPSRKPLVELTLPDTPESTTSTLGTPSALADGDPSSPLRFSKPIPLRTRLPAGKDEEKGSLPMLDLPFPSMKAVVLPEAPEEEHPHFKPMYTQSYVNGMVEAMKHAHATIAKMSQEKREVEGRLGVLEEKQGMWHALVHGQGCGCGEVRWWREVEEVLIEKRGGLGVAEKGGDGSGKGGRVEEGRFGMDGACDDDEEEDAWDVILGSSVGST